MRATLYAIPGSHAVRTGELMLEHKGIEFARVNYPPGPHRVLVRLRGFPGDRVPAVLFEDGRRAQGTRELPRVLDELQPEPRLIPDDPRALEAEVWADDRGAGGRLGPLLTRHERPRRFVSRMVQFAFGVTEQQQRRDRELTGEILDRVDAWIEEGVLNGERLYSADFAIASSLALVEYVVALQPELRRRPLMGLIDRVFSDRGAARGPA